jgi:cytoskeletal protein RodZ
MKTNLEQRLAVALVSTEHADSLLAKCAAPAALSAPEKASLAIALADKKAADEVEKVLLARADVTASAAAKAAADAAKTAADTAKTAADTAKASALAAAAADPEDEDLAAAATAATAAAATAATAATAAAADALAKASALTAAQAAKAALVPMSRNARDRIEVALADKKAGEELIAKIHG